MAIRIIIDINVDNPDEVIKAHKGQIYGLLSGVVLSKESKQKKVNQAVAHELMEIVKEDLPKELDKEMVKASVYYKVIDEVETEDDYTKIL